MSATKVSIAYQGGGTHDVEVLTEILKMKKVWDAGSEPKDTFDIIAIGGTSAGALYALAHAISQCSRRTKA